MYVSVYIFVSISGTISLSYAMLSSLGWLPPMAEVMRSGPRSLRRRCPRWCSWPRTHLGAFGRFFSGTIDASIVAVHIPNIGMVSDTSFIPQDDISDSENFSPYSTSTDALSSHVNSLGRNLKQQNSKIRRSLFAKAVRRVMPTKVITNAL